MAEHNLFALFGTDEPPERTELLEAGALTAELRGGNLGKIRFDGVEVVRGIAFLARDRNWGTLPSKSDGIAIEKSAGRFRVTYRARCENGNAVFVYDAVIEGSKAGALTFSVEGKADSAFETNRTGFIVLHPLAGVAGHAMDVLHTDGTSETVVLPAVIAPTPPIGDIETLRYSPVEGLAVSIRMTGDAYQMEDQRNWTDASFKTFFRPLSKPHPYTLRADEPVRQSVEVRIDGHAAAAALHRKDRLPAPAKPMPAIGLAVDLADADAANDVRAAVVDMKPQSLVVRFDPGASDSRAKLHAVAALARSCLADVTLEAIVDGRPLQTQADFRAAKQATAEASLGIAAVVPCPRRDLRERAPGSLADGEAPLAAILADARRYFPETRIGGGSLTYFAEFNANPPPPDAIDFLTHGTSAVVHAADDAAVMETLESLPFIFRTARARVPDRPYRLGPSSIGMRENPYGDATAPNPENRRIEGARRDPRHRALFGAAWTLGYWAQATANDIDHLTLAHVAGDFGVAETTTSGIALFPLFHALRGAARAAGREKAPVETRLEQAAVAWVTSTGGVETWIANLTAKSVDVEPPAGATQVAILDSTNVREASRSLDFMDRTKPVDANKPVGLGPYAIVRFTA